MPEQWVVTVPVCESASLSSLRLWPHVCVFVVDDVIWVRGNTADEVQSRTLLTLPASDRFEVHEGRRLFRPLERTPSGTLPDGDWIPIADWIEVTLPVARVVTARIPRMTIQLARSGEPPKPAEFLITNGAAWVSWGATAPQVRLDSLWFAASGEGRILVRGHPLPPLPGEQFAEHDNIAVPCGWTWRPAVSAEAVRRAANVEDGALLILLRDGTHETVRTNDFVPARRSAIRQTSPV